MSVKEPAVTRLRHAHGLLQHRYVEMECSMTQGFSAHLAGLIAGKDTPQNNVSSALSSLNSTTGKKAKQKQLQ